MSAADLDRLFGDPWDADNPHGYAAILRADEQREMFADGEKLLNAYGLNAEIVPAQYGGRFTRADELAETLRTVWRRDPSLGLGYGFSSLLASINIWTAGSDQQRRTAADLLLGSGRIAAAFHELEHGNDFANADCAARPTPHGWTLTGRKEVVTNLRRAEAMVLFARTADGAGSRAHSLFWLERGALPADRVRDLPRLPGSGLRGVQLGGADFDDCPIGAESLIGRPGAAIETALRSFQVTRVLLPAVTIGPLDTALRAATGFALERRLYGATAADLPFVRTTLARAYADLLAMDCLCAVGLRALHLAPETMGVYAPAIKYLTSKMLLDAFEALRAVLGAQAYIRQGPYAIFEKLSRDIAPATFAHVSRAACLVMLLPQLPRLARRSWAGDVPGSAELFSLGAHLPALRLDALTAGSPRADPILDVLATFAGHEDPGGPIASYAARLLDELARLRKDCLALTPAQLTIDAPPEAFALAERYTVLLAAACALAVWQHAAELRPAEALALILDRLTARLGGPPVRPAAERAAAESALFDDLVARCRQPRLLDLSARPIPG